MNGALSSVDFDEASLRAKIAAIPNMVGLDLAQNVTIDKPMPWGKSCGGCLHVVALHAGIKTNILRLLNARGCDITLVPANWTAEQILELKPDGVFISNGPGDPEPMDYAIEAIAKLIGKVPIFGICLGHELLAFAVGGKCYKLKFGHRGANHPVKNLKTGRIEIASHNHGFAVDGASLPPEMEITHVNLNDRTVAGIRHKKYPAFSVQYHPKHRRGLTIRITFSTNSSRTCRRGKAAKTLPRTYLIIRILCQKSLDGRSGRFPGGVSRAFDRGACRVRGAEDRIAGVTHYCDYPPELTNLPIVGDMTTVDYEAILRIRPYLIIASYSGNSRESVERLEGMGFETLTLKETTVADIVSNVAILGEVFGTDTTALRKSLTESSSGQPS
jgi:anthranilate/para-aminobenzoate synthase component II